MADSTYSPKDVMNLAILAAVASAVIMVVWATYDEGDEANHNTRRKLSIAFASLALGAVVLMSGLASHGKGFVGSLVADATAAAAPSSA